MPLPTIFTTTNFNPASLPEHSYVFDANGWIGPVGQEPLGDLGYNATYLNQFLQDGFWDIGYQSLIYDVAAQFPNARYFYTTAESVTVVSGNSQTTTNYLESGIQGTGGSDVIFDINGDDIYVTGGGADLIVDLGGNNAIDAGAGNDVIWTMNGDDVVKAGSGDDIVMTWGGVDNVLAGTGNDRVELGEGDDFAWGNRGNDTLRGGDGADMLDGGGDNDLLEGGGGADILLGGGGVDRLVGGGGNDQLTGGGGADTFVFAGLSGDDVVTDFRRNADHIEIEIATTGLTRFADVQTHAAQLGSDVVISFVDGSVTLENINLNQLNSGHFDFV